VAAEQAMQMMAGRYDVWPERISDFGEGRLTGLDHLPGEVVRVHNRDAAITQNLCSGGLAHANAAGEPEGFHVRRIEEGRPRASNPFCFAVPGVDPQ
jgi:hypothetical protein